MKTEKLANKLIWAAIIAYAAFFSYLSILKYQNFIYNDFDLAIDAQTLWNITHGSLYSSIHQIVFLGNHMRLILFLIAPLYAIFKSPILLLVLQSIALGMGAYPVYKIASEELNKKFGLIFAFAYLLYPALGYLNLYEFHPTALATCFLLFALYYFKSNCFYKFILFSMLAMFCQENIPLIIIMTGIYAFILKKPLKWKVAPVILGVGYFYISIFVVMPYFNKNSVQFVNLFGRFGDSLLEIAKNMLFNPVAVLRIMFKPDKLLYLFELLAPLLFLPLLAPATVLMALPVFLQHFLSIRHTETSLYYHYSAELIPILFFSAIFGVKRALSLQLSKKENILFLFVIVTFASNIALGPHLYIYSQIPDLKRNILDYQKERLLGLVPKEVPVVATFQFLPKLSNRPFLYSFHHVYYGYHTLSEYGKYKKKYLLPENADFALINFNDPMTFKGFYSAEGASNLRSFLEDGRWGIVYLSEAVCLLRKNLENSYKLYEVGSEEPDVENIVNETLTDGLELLGYNYNFSKDAIGQWLDISFIYKCSSPIRRKLGCFVDLLNSASMSSKSIIVRRATHEICYGVYPTDQWGAYPFVKENYRFLLSSPQGPILENAAIKIGFLDLETHKPLCKTLDCDTAYFLGIEAKTVKNSKRE